MRVRCTTNIDCCKRLDWPDDMPECPRVGDLIRSPSSTPKKHIELKVCRVTWVRGDDYEWVPEVELTMIPTRFETEREFENWVNRG